VVAAAKVLEPRPPVPAAPPLAQELVVPAVESKPVLAQVWFWAGVAVVAGGAAAAAVVFTRPHDRLVAPWAPLECASPLTTMFAIIEPVQGSS